MSAPFQFRACNFNRDNCYIVNTHFVALCGVQDCPVAFRFRMIPDGFLFTLREFGVDTVLSDAVKVRLWSCME